MRSYKFPTMSILVATTIGIASVATPVHAAPGFNTGVVGSACAATQNHHAKINVQTNGGIANKNNGAAATISCPLPLEFNRNTSVFVSFQKFDNQSLSCVFHRRSFDFLSGATTSQSTINVGVGSFTFNAVTNFLNSVQCTIPRNNGAGQNRVNGIVWFN